ncbi:hypothetical protein HID58_009598 [Brassica napus]|nr:hypothetical protein HID58_024228 [Brassica napus]KAH0932481.1 hypothetical protein HID58_009598 [Brassica napus]
MSFHLTR